MIIWMETSGLILLLIVSFLSSIVGTIIGTAMLILPPVMIFLGVPVHTSIATARFSLAGMGVGNLTKFSMKEKVQLRYVLPFAVSGAAGSLMSALLLKDINEIALKKAIGILMIAVSILILFEDYVKSKTRKKHTTKHHLLSVVGGFFVGSYIGIIGGGGATIIIFFLILIYGLSFQDAIANQKAITLPMSIVATIVFIYQGLIDYRLGVPMLLANIFGGWVGAELVLRFDNKWLKRILVPIIILLAIRLIGIV